ncbi:LysE family translocator [Cupriavidus sp. RAF12]|uniref:LysE family translocator n=1 Tax=Cupriavidus sp. RAF12 TaxID=3233050 RepID=UPI003F8FE72B
MTDLATLSVFAVAVMFLLMSPGPNMMFVVTHGVTYGWSGGVASALGIGAADLVLTILTATGIAAVVGSMPMAFDVIRYCGAAYLLWMAWKCLQAPAAPGGAIASQATLKAVFARAMLNSLLNPKALLFFVVFLPQFVVPGHGPVARQLLILGAVLTAIAIVFHAALGVGSGAVRRFLDGNPKFARLQSLGLATVLVLLALRLIVMVRPA